MFFQTAILFLQNVLFFLIDSVKLFKSRNGKRLTALLTKSIYNSCIANLDEFHLHRMKVVNFSRFFSWSTSLFSSGHVLCNILGHLGIWTHDVGLHVGFLGF